MKRIPLFFFVLFMASLFLLSCNGNENPEQDKTYRVMVALDDGFTVTTQNPIEVKDGENAVFGITVEEGYVFASASAGIFDETSGTLTVSGVTERMNITFTVEKLGYDPSVSYSYIFKGGLGDFSSVKNSSSVSAGTLITVTSINEERHFVGWSYGKKAVDGGKIVSAERVFQFRLLPDIVTDGVLYVYANYTDSNVFYYDLNGGTFNANTANMKANVYYTTTHFGSKLKVTLTDKYFSYAECASLFWDDGTFTRDGYVLKEYNTQPDGSGEGYSLGSKFYAPTDTGVLYCIWEKANPVTHFDYEDATLPIPVDSVYASHWNENGVIITSYNGDGSKVVVPEKINGKPVIAIGEGAFSGENIETLVLPRTILKIEDCAFTDCSSLTTLYFPDSVYYLSDAIFDTATYENFKNLIVNATMAPRYSNTADGAFAVKLSRLMAARDKKKIVVISGSSTYQGLGTEYMEALFEGEYTVVNFGTTRTRPGHFYLEAMSHFTDTDDIIVYAPENSTFMMGETYLNYKMLYEIEGMYNLYRYVDISNYHGYFSSFAELNRDYRYIRPERKYENICEVTAANKYGDYQHKDRGRYDCTYYADAYYITFNKRYKSMNEGPWSDVANQAQNKDYTDLQNPTWKSIDEPDMLRQMNFAIRAAKSSGAKVYFGFCPADANAVVEAARNEEWLLLYDEMIRENYCFDGLVGTAKDYIFNHKYFYDCAFHPNDYGRTYRTYTLYLDIAELLGIDDPSGIYEVGTEYEGCLFEAGSDGTPVTKVDFLD